MSAHQRNARPDAVEPLMIWQEGPCTVAEGFHCRIDEGDGHTLHCVQCHQYAEDKMDKQSMTVYKYQRVRES